MHDGVKCGEAAFYGMHSNGAIALKRGNLEAGNGLCGSGTGGQGNHFGGGTRGLGQKRATAALLFLPRMRIRLTQEVQL